MMQVAVSSDTVQILAMEHCVRDENFVRYEGTKELLAHIIASKLAQASISLMCSFLPHTYYGK
jgi:hypothetical protein